MKYTLRPARADELHFAFEVKHDAMDDALLKADAGCQETRIEHLKWNPVASLYARHGFKIVGETGAHYSTLTTRRGMPCNQRKSPISQAVRF